MANGVEERIDEGVLRWFGHLERMERDMIAKSRVVESESEFSTRVESESEFSTKVESKSEFSTRVESESLFVKYEMEMSEMFCFIL